MILFVLISYIVLFVAMAQIRKQVLLLKPLSASIAHYQVLVRYKSGQLDWSPASEVHGTCCRKGQSTARLLLHPVSSRAHTQSPAFQRKYHPGFHCPGE